MPQKDAGGDLSAAEGVAKIFAPSCNTHTDRLGSWGVVYFELLNPPKMSSPAVQPLKIYTSFAG